MNRTCIVFLCCLSCSPIFAGDKYALLAAVREYEHSEMNEPLLQYPEVDAKSMRDLLKESGYVVDLLLAKEATQTNIRKKLVDFSEKGGNKGVVLVGLFGHGIEFDSTKKSYFCPYDTSVKAKRDAQGQVISDDNGKPRMEPKEEKLISIDEILLALRESKATNRILLADCCRNDPNAARGRSFGTSLGTNQLPEDAAVFFACKATQKAFEHPEWGHGAFTKCLLDAIKNRASRGESMISFIAADVQPAVEKLVASKVDATQTPRLLSTSALVDLQLVLSTSKPTTIPPPSTKPSMTSDKPTIPPLQPSKPQEISSRGFEGSKAGDRKELNGIAFRWCPAGTFTMGSPKTELGFKNKRNDNENQVSVTLTTGFWLGETEVTQSQWQKITGTTPWEGAESYAKGGPDYPASYVSHDDAVLYCKKMTTQERRAGRLPNGWTFSLPTEAQWEYACRAGTQTKYSFGESESQLGEYGWFDKNAWLIKEYYAHQVGKKKPNAWGLCDMHGNALEWCSDWYGEKLPGGKDPVGPTTGSDRVIRSGTARLDATNCRSANRKTGSPDFRSIYLGFRLAAVPE